MRRSDCWPRQPGSGYDLLKHFEKSMANVWPATQSQLYGELNKLADAGLIEVSDIGPRGRKEYRITERRARRTAALGDEPAGRSAVPRAPGCCACSCSARCRPSRPASTCSRWQSRPKPRSSAWNELRDSIDWTDGDGLFYGRAALEYGLRMNAMEADWANWLVNAIDERSIEIIVASR